MFDTSAFLILTFWESRQVTEMYLFFAEVARKNSSVL